MGVPMSRGMEAAVNDEEAIRNRACLWLFALDGQALVDAHNQVADIFHERLADAKKGNDALELLRAAHRDAQRELPQA